MALDLMEPVRPRQRASCSKCSLRVPSAKPSSRDPEGHVRLRAPLTHELAETMPRWARSLAPRREGGPHARPGDGGSTPGNPAHLDQLRSAQAVVKARKAEAVGRAGRDAIKQRPTASVALPLYTCHECGGRSPTLATAVRNLQRGGPPAKRPSCERAGGGPLQPASVRSKSG